jgi:hypothetical protein
VETTQTIVGSSCLFFDLAPNSVNGADLSWFLVVAWAIHPDLIPMVVGCVIPEPEEPFVQSEPPLFLHDEEVIHYKRNTIQFHVFFKILEMHDFKVLENFDDDQPKSHDSDSSGDDGYPGYDPSHRMLQPWPQATRQWESLGHPCQVMVVGWPDR